MLSNCVGGDVGGNVAFAGEDLPGPKIGLFLQSLMPDQASPPEGELQLSIDQTGGADNSTRLRSHVDRSVERMANPPP